jgi:signal transduction histidine kinase
VGVSAALLLATAALSGLSIQSVYREAQVRRRLITDTHRSIADVVSARLDAAMQDADRAVADEIQNVKPQAQTLLKKFQELEGSRPWLQLLVLVSSSRPDSNPQAAGSDGFENLFAAAERAEFREKPRDAVALYAKGASAAGAGIQRAKALNGEARSELKAGDPLRAAEAYKKLIDETETLDSEQARLSVIARDQLIVCYRLLQDTAKFRSAVLDLYQFLVAHRFILDNDTYAFYRRELDGTLTQIQHELDPIQADLLPRLRAREQQSNSMAALLRAPNALVTTTALGSTGAQVAHVWTISNVRSLLEHLLADSGLWSGVGVAIVEDGAVPSGAVPATLPLARTTNWRVSTFPKSGSVEALASRDVIRFAALLVLVVGTVVTAMVLAARSVARELALSRTRADFVASVSHELKTPLSLIRMFAESLREGWVNEDKRADYYEVITRESERLTGLINNVLDFSRLESGTRTYQRATADLCEILRGLLDRYVYHLKAAKIDLIQQVPERPVYAFVDAEAIEQVLVNLLSNSVKYMGAAERQPRYVRVSLTTTGHQTVIQIADSGIGISNEARVHMFERFWRADDERVRAVAGSGLGLTLVKHIVEAHDGTIEVEGELDRGTCFAVKLPAVGAQL